MKELGNTALIWKLSEEDYNTFVDSLGAAGISVPYSKYIEQIEEAKRLSIERGDRIVLLLYTLEEVLDALEELGLNWSSENCHKALTHIMNNQSNTEE